MSEPQPDSTPSVIESIAETAVETPDDKADREDDTGGLVPPDHTQPVQPPA